MNLKIITCTFFCDFFRSIWNSFVDRENIKICNSRNRSYPLNINKDKLNTFLFFFFLLSRFTNYQDFLKEQILCNSKKEFSRLSNSSLTGFKVFIIIFIMLCFILCGTSYIYYTIIYTYILIKIFPQICLNENIKKKYTNKKYLTWRSMCKIKCKACFPNIFSTHKFSFFIESNHPTLIAAFIVFV